MVCQIPDLEIIGKFYGTVIFDYPGTVGTYIRYHEFFGSLSMRSDADKSSNCQGEKGKNYVCERFIS